MLSGTLETTLRKALYIASRYKHEYATYEHLLLALLEDKDAKAALLEKNIDIKAIIRKLVIYLKKNLADLVSENVKEARPTAGFQRIVQRAVLHKQASGQKSIDGTDVLAEFFFEHESYALACLKAANLRRSDVSHYLRDHRQTRTSANFSENPGSNIISSADPESAYNVAASPALRDLKPQVHNGIPMPGSFDESNEFVSPARVSNGVSDRRESVKEHALQQAETELEKYCVNLNAKAKEDDIDCLIGRQPEIQRTIEILCRRRKNNAILVGEPGVGKTAIAEGLAMRIVKNDVPDILKNAVIYSLDIGSLVAGTKFRGDFEERIKVMLECLKKLKNAILFIDEIHSIIGAGSTTSGALDASNLLKPALASGGLRCIGSTTFKEFRNYFEKDMALVRRFQKIVVEEPDEEATFNILKGLKGYYEEHHNVIYTDEALRVAINLSERYINDRHLPDKAIDLIDEAGSRSKTNSHDNNDHDRAVVTITGREIETLVASILNIPDLELATDDIEQIRELEGRLKNSIFGQDEAIERLCASIRLSKAGLKKLARPTGCYLFVGPTGVGKTELAKQLAHFCHMKLLKYDMSEFTEASSVSKMLGSAPGYVGFDQGGVLTDEVDKHPYSVVLFDEIEKANNEIYNLLLQVMDEGVLTTSAGKKVNFSHCIIILTSNVVTQKKTIGFSDGQEMRGHSEDADMEAVNAEFSPEFRSRLDKIILFNPIDKIVDKIIAKNLNELKSQLADKKVRFIVSDDARKHFAEKCFGEHNGARILDRVIDIEIKQPIADEILFGKLKNGGVVNIDFSEKLQKLVFKFTAINNKKKLGLELETN